MARARNIKPGFFTNEDLVECSYAARLIFPGLWMLADREGRLEDRPKKIKMAIFPADTIDIDELLGELECRGFIKRYTADNKKVISIPQFLEHQNPHGREQDSVLPDENGYYKVNTRKNDMVTGEYSLVKSLVNNESSTKTEQAQCKHSASTVQAHDQHHASPADSLIPDSLIPDSKDTVITHTVYPSQQSREPTPGASVCLELKKVGIIDLNPAHPKLLMLIESGATIDEFMHAARTAKDKQKGFKYVLGIVEGQRTEAAQAKDKVLQGTIQNKADALLNRNKESTRNWKPPELRAQNDGT
ncbi:MAG: hypothetical protein HRU77_01615 [Gammaproteobacteria bacterium]|nr:MAG: hypothetical protein HRU77_01615 [Gammaproteobacteria bacterium]